MASDNSTQHEVFLSTSEDGLTPGKVIADGAVFMGLGIIVVALRFWARIKYTKALPGIDDWLILISLVESNHSRSTSLS